MAAASNAHLLEAITPPQRLDDFLAVPDEPTKYRIDGLFPIGGRIMLSAQYKAGKTTAVGNLIRSLADGDPFLGKFATTPVRKVTLLDNELDARTLRSWLRDQGVQNTTAAAVEAMRGKVGTFNIIDPEIRARWAEVLHGTDFLILDVLRPVLDALGLDENRDAGRFLVAFDALLAEAGIPEGAIIHHMGHTGERSRGDSRLQDWPDAIWRLVRTDPDDPSSPRYFSAYGRDVEVPEGQVAYDIRTRNLTYAAGSRKDAASSEAEGHIKRHLTESPGSSGREIEIALTANPGLTQKAIRDGLKAVISSGEVQVIPGAKRARLHYLAETKLAGQPAA
ncbi:AAA family ATPase [Williamsia sp. DF01-3]|uniref:ATP-binding protein n=1 Tax=Williamsia sp. DF01-3 TaxID=2934157 RepID=UPI001FF68536|nr:AAA family ATPase [Williamsia sp. DF01-3]MCK0516980.1 AAA family ATPase [Williamsia sp. DF01-3]